MKYFKWVVKVLLLNGISGFVINALPEVYTSQFKKLCHSFANLTHGKFVSFELPHVSQNFYKAVLEFNEGMIFILLNSSYPIVAFASSVEYFNILFIDHPHSNFIKTFSDVFTVATVNELLERLEMDDRTQTVLNDNNLNKSELSRIFYWKPKTVGEVVFNFWD
jgi:hypothetical protein